jgi:hypothetical protein
VATTGVAGASSGWINMKLVEMTDVVLKSFDPSELKTAKLRSTGQRELECGHECECGCECECECGWLRTMIEMKETKDM